MCGMKMVCVSVCVRERGGAEVSCFRPAQTGLAKLCLGVGEREIVACNATHFSCSLQKIPLSQYLQDWCQGEAGG